MSQKEPSNEHAANDCVVIGDKYLINCFRLIGIRAVETVNDDSAADEARRTALQENPRVIIITEKVAIKLKSFRDNLLKTRKLYPLFLIVPDFDGSIHERTRELRQLVSETVGVKLKLGD